MGEERTKPQGEGHSAHKRSLKFHTDWGPTGLESRHMCVSGPCPEGAVERSQKVPSQEVSVAQSEFQGTRRILLSNVFIEQWFQQFHSVFGDFSGSKAQECFLKSSRGELKMESS